MSAPTVDGERLLRRLGELRRIGATTSGGVTREAFGPLDVEARTLVERWLADAGIDATVDAATNLVGRLPGRTPRWLATGSHLDTVVDGGWLDGAYGVAAAVEVAVTLSGSASLDHGLLVTAFANEEGARGTDGMTGSRALIGQVSADELDLLDDDGVTVRGRLAGAGGDPDAIATAAWDLAAIDAFVELHIEQGPVLEARGDVLGLVLAITGRQALDVHIAGRANHAGTTPMDLRHDGLATAAEIVLEIERVALDGEVRVATCGHLVAAPNVRNVVPGDVRLSAELRDESPERLEAGFVRLERAIAEVATRRRVEIGVTRGQLVPPVHAAPGVVVAIEEAIVRSGLAWSTLPSGAGHDAQILGLEVPMGMIFVPSISGVSHAPVEDTDPAHLVAGAQALLDTILVLDQEAP